MTLEEKVKYVDDILKQYRAAFKDDSLTLEQVYQKVNNLINENNELKERLKKLKSVVL